MFKGLYEKNKRLLPLVLVFVCFYLFFYGSVLFAQKFIVGNDSIQYFYPMRFYLYKSLTSLRFPFWTEKMLGGFPIYADGESGYLNLLNILSILIFGPFTSYKILHFGFYLAGSLGFAKLLLRKRFSNLGIIVSVLIYYFSFFLLFHQQHFGMILSFYLMPLVIFYLDKIIEKSTNADHSWLIVTLLVISYFGSYQSVVLIFIAMGLYYISHVKDFLGFKPHTVPFIFTLGVYFSLLIPLVYPSMRLYLNSDRVSDENIHLEGSYNPLMISNVAFPFLFDRDEDYRWNTISNDYLEHETYVYIGITTVLLSTITLLLLDLDSNLKKFTYFTILIYLLLGHLRYIPFLKHINIPIVNLFKYWGRSFILLNFSMSVLAGYFISFSDKIIIFSKKTKVRLWNRWFFIVITIFISSVIFSFVDSSTSNTILLQVKNGAIPFDLNFKIWLLLLFLISSVILFTNTTLRKGILVGLVVFDLLFFGKQVLKSSIGDFEKIYNSDYVAQFDEFENERVFSTSGRSMSNQGLYLKSWSLLGYSQFYSSEYADYLSDFGISKAKRFDGNMGNLCKLSDIGVSRVFDEGLSICSLENVSILNLDGYVDSYTMQEFGEGKFVFDVESGSEVLITTRVKNISGWKIKINNEKQKIGSGLFLNFVLPEGSHHVELLYVPRDFYLSLFISLSIFGVLMTLRSIYKKTISV